MRTLLYDLLHPGEVGDERGPVFSVAVAICALVVSLALATAVAAAVSLLL